MATNKEVLLNVLEHMTVEELKKFKWYLQQQEILKDFPAIPICRLENAVRVDTVDEMVRIYSKNAVKVARMVLEKMGRKDLVGKLLNTMSGSTGELFKKREHWGIRLIRRHWVVVQMLMSQRLSTAVLHLSLIRSGARSRAVN